MTFNVFSAGQKVLAAAFMQNFRHVNYGGPLLPVDVNGGSVNNTIDLGSSSYRFKDVYYSGIVNDGVLDRRVRKTASGSINAGQPVGLLLSDLSKVILMEGDISTATFLGFAVESKTNGQIIEIAVDKYDLGSTAYSVGDILFVKDDGALTKSEITDNWSSDADGTKNVTNYVPCAYVYDISSGTKIMINGITHISQYPHYMSCTLSPSYVTDGVNIQGIGTMTMLIPIQYPNSNMKLQKVTFQGFYGERSGNADMDVRLKHRKTYSNNILNNTNLDSNGDRILYMTANNIEALCHVAEATHLYVNWTQDGAPVSYVYPVQCYFVDQVKLSLIKS